jgi:hypothetical protein
MVKRADRTRVGQSKLSPHPRRKGKGNGGGEIMPISIMAGKINQSLLTALFMCFCSLTRQTVVNIKTSTPSKSGATTVTNANGTVDVIPATKPGGVDINAVGTIDGVEIFDVDLDGAEDKPWRKPGADLTDYFNYGFNETIWRAYCHKQKMMRDNPFAVRTFSLSLSLSLSL